MSITSLIRTLTATSIDGFPALLVNWGDTVIWFEGVDDASEQTAAITSPTSAVFRRSGCCSLKNHAGNESDFCDKSEN